MSPGITETNEDARIEFKMPNPYGPDFITITLPKELKQEGRRMVLNMCEEEFPSCTFAISEDGRVEITGFKRFTVFDRARRWVKTIGRSQ